MQTDTSSYGKNIPIDTTSLFNQVKGFCEIEGLWVSYCGEIAVIRDPSSNNYVGVSVSYSGWKPGQVMFEFAAMETEGTLAGSHPPTGDTLFKVKEFTSWKGARNRKTMASLHVDRHVLEIHDVRFFVRKSLSARSDGALMKSYTPVYPNGSNTYFTYGILSDSMLFMRVNSFDRLKEKIEKMIREHWEDIMKRPNVIIDLRNNGGGQDDELQMLLSLIYTTPYLSL